ncbi:MAG: alpha/beta hydrolase [Leptospiraceae bacterium]|nr:alpha/beta hydrolase [Leptospiraceae bacterium]MCP5510974.1 alpha/beta hydrolase [Leptospiraceae bacterium]
MRLSFLEGETVAYKIIFFFSFFFILNCSNFLYSPTREKYFDPKEFGYQTSEIELKAEDGIHTYGTLITSKNQSNSKNTVILLFNGNGENQSSHFLSLVWMVDRGYDLVTYDYRGYGRSEGKPNPGDINSDVVKFIENISLYCKINRKNLILYGQSLGGAITMRALADVKDKSLIKLVIIEGSFTSYRKVARTILRKNIFPPLHYLLSFFVTDSYSPEEKISEISPIPLIVIHETEDPIVPFENGKSIFQLANDPKQFWEVRSDGHIRWMNMGRDPNAQKFLELLNRFILMNDQSID